MSEWDEFDFEPADKSDHNGIVHLIHKLRANWYWFALCGALGLAAAYLYLRYSTPVYRINAKILVTDEEKGAGIAGTSSVLADLGGMLGSKSTVDNEVEVLKTRSLMERVVRELDANITYYRKGSIRDVELFQPPFRLEISGPADIPDHHVFELVRDGEHGAIISSDDFRQPIRYGGEFELPGIGRVRIIRNDSIPFGKDPYLLEITSLDKQVANYMKRLSVEVSNKLVTVIDLRFEYPVKEKGEHILKTLITKYVNRNLQDKNTIADSTIAFIEERLVVVGQELGNVEGNIETFKQRSQLADMSAQSQLLLESSSEYVKQLAEIETQLSIVQSMQDVLRDGENSRVLPSAILPGDEVFAGLAEQYNLLLLERDRKLLSSTPENPAVINLSSQIDHLRKDMLGNLQSLTSSLSIKRDDLMKKTGQLERKIRKVPATERTYLDLARQQQIKQELYVFLLQKREETAISKTSNISNSKVIDEPKAAHRPISPKKIFVWAIGLAAGLFLPAFVIYLRELLNTRIRNREDITRRTEVPVIAEISHNKSKETELVALKSRSILAEEFRSLRTNLAFYLKSKDQKVVLLTSSMGSEGKSFTALNLAMVIAVSGKKVVIMEMDLRKPKLRAKINHLSNIGFSNYAISETMTSDEIISPSGVHENLFLISSGPIPPNPSELILSERTNQLMDALNNNFDYIIIDAPPIGLVTDAQLLSKYASLTLFLIRQGHTYKNQVSLIEDLNKDQRVGAMAVLVNDIKPNGSYGYGYGYNYGYGYRYGYYDESSK